MTPHRLAAVEQPSDLLLVSGCDTTLKRPEAFESGSQKIAALRSPVPVHPADPGIFDVEVHGVAEDDQLHQRRHKQQHAHARLAKRLQQFFTKDLP